MPKIIISYRRTHDAIAGRIRDKLVSRYGDASIFMDVDNIPFGIDFRKHIDHELREGDVMIAVIGPNWVGAADDHAPRILDNTDPVRVEVETALRQAIPVIPILVGGATMPRAQELPEAIRDLAYCNAATVDAGRDFHQHMDRIMRSVDRTLRERRPGARSHKRLSAAAAGIAAIVVAGGIGWLLVPERTNDSPGAPISPEASAAAMAAPQAPTPPAAVAPVAAPSAAKPAPQPADLPVRGSPVEPAPAAATPPPAAADSAVASAAARAMTPPKSEPSAGVAPRPPGPATARPLAATGEPQRPALRRASEHARPAAPPPVSPAAGEAARKLAGLPAAAPKSRPAAQPNAETIITAAEGEVFRLCGHPDYTLSFLVRMPGATAPAVSLSRKLVFSMKGPAVLTEGKSVKLQDGCEVTFTGLSDGVAHVAYLSERTSEAR